MSALVVPSCSTPYPLDGAVFLFATVFRFPLRVLALVRAFIPGVRQGKPTQDFLESTMNRITLVGALLLALIAILPSPASLGDGAVHDRSRCL